MINKIRNQKTARTRRKMLDLKVIREDIDAVDKQIQELFEKRMELASQVAAYKIATGKPVYDKVREDEKLEVFKKRASTSFNGQCIQELFLQIMGMSRKYQYQLLSANGKSERLDFKPVDVLRMDGMKVVYQGVEGAYSYAATRAFFGDDAEVFHVKTWKDAMEAIASGTADYAVLPIENSTAGSVYDNYDLLEEYNLHIVGEQIVKCEHVLMGTPDATIDDIKVVYSHPQALMQCKGYLDQHEDWKQLQYVNTAVAAQKVAKDQDKTQAAIANPYAAEIHGLKILQREIYDNENNSTRFIVVAKQKIFLKNAQKVSICLELPHEKGSLYNILSHIIFNNLNMTKIESRPIFEKNWEYRFFIDFEGNLMDSGVQNALCGIEQEAPWLRVIGNY